MLGGTGERGVLCASSLMDAGRDRGKGALRASLPRACRCSDHYSDNLLGYANSIRTADGGTHMEGFRAAVTRVCNTAARKLKLLRVSLGRAPAFSAVCASLLGCPHALSRVALLRSQEPFCVALAGLFHGAFHECSCAGQG